MVSFTETPIKMDDDWWYPHDETETSLWTPRIRVRFSHAFAGLLRNMLIQSHDGSMYVWFFVDPHGPWIYPSHVRIYTIHTDPSWDMLIQMIQLYHVISSYIHKVVPSSSESRSVGANSRPISRLGWLGGSIYSSWGLYTNKHNSGGTTL